MKVFICDDVDDRGNPILNSGCGVIEHILFDGYDFGERTLEGVKFKAWINKKNEVEVSSVNDWDTDPYLTTLNKSHWIPIAKDHIEDYDIATCPYCGNDIDAQPQEH